MKKLALAAVLLALPAAAHAHTGGGDSHGFTHGFGHPLMGLDHLLAMIAIGLWAVQIGGSALWAVPLAFVFIMALAGAAGMAGMTLPFVEQGIAASVLLLGLLIALAVRLPLAWSVPLVAAFAIFHGSAHGAEMPADASGLTYALGFIIATTMLHAFGIGAGMLIQNKASLLRSAGAAIALVGAAFFF